MPAKQFSLVDPHILFPALRQSFAKLDPRLMVRNPVMFVTEVGAALTTLEVFRPGRGESLGFVVQIALWLWFTVLFANFAEAMAEGRGKAQADELRKTRTTTVARKFLGKDQEKKVAADELRKGDVVVVSAGEVIPADGEIIEGAATVDESAITG